MQGVLYAFDPKRQAVLLIGGDKTGQRRFYAEMFVKAECIRKDYRRETKQAKGRLEKPLR